MKYIKSFNNIDSGLKKLGFNPVIKNDISNNIIDNYNKLERFIRQSKLIINGQFKIDKDMSIDDNLMLLCDNIKIGPDELNDLIKMNKLDKNSHYMKLLSSLTDLYSDWD